MDLSNYLAQIWGLFLIIVPLSMIINEKNIKIIFDITKEESKMFVWGIATFLLGLASILSHNIWTKNWQMIVTILGWGLFIKGVAILFFPEDIILFSKKFENKKWLPFALTIVIFLGLALSYLGFTK